MYSLNLPPYRPSPSHTSSSLKSRVSSCIRQGLEVCAVREPHWWTSINTPVLYSYDERLLAIRDIERKRGEVADPSLAFCCYAS